MKIFGFKVTMHLCSTKIKLPLPFLQQLAIEFNLRIVRTYGAAVHGKGVINAMSSFEAKDALRRDIVTHVFFN